MKRVPHVGRDRQRLANNDLERIFAASWEDENNRPNQRYSLLDMLLYGDGIQTCLLASKVEREKVATVVQWLGSPIGFGWLRNTLDKAGYDVTARKGAKS